MYLRLMVCGLLAVLLAGCKPPVLSKDMEAANAALYRAVGSGDDAGLRRMAGPELITPEATTGLVQVRAMMPKESARSSKIVSWSVINFTGGKSTVTLATEHDYGDRFVLSQAVLSKDTSEEPWQARGFHVQTATKAELAANRFSLIGKSPGHYLFLAAAVASIGLMIAAFVKVVRTRGLRRKWLWCLAALLGLFKFQINWATGAVAVQWLSVQLIGAAATRGPSQFEPWVIASTAPIGAVLILAGIWANPARARPRETPPQDVF